MSEDDGKIYDLDEMYKTVFRRIWLENGVWRRNSIESILSRISDEEFVRLKGRIDRLTLVRNQKKEKGDNKEVRS